jgi:hypothetical protein
LGVDPGEFDQQKIWGRAQCQIDRILEADPSLESPHVRRIFDELQAARDCLCNPQKRQEYDAQLRERSSAGSPPAAIPTAESPVMAAVEPAPARRESFDPSCMILPEEDLPEAFDTMPVLPEDDLSTPFVTAPVEPKPARLESIESARVTPPAHDVSEPFDQYREWLGIADQKRPLNHYLLLGLTPYEADLAKIDEISMRQMARVLERDPALDTETGVCLFGELDAARNCLCDPRQKQAYDAWLREGRTAKRIAGGTPGTTSSAKQESSFDLAPRVLAVPHRVRDERISSSAALAVPDNVRDVRISSTVAAAADTISRHVSSHDAPETARPPAPVAWYVRHTRLTLAVLSGMLVVAAIANYPTNR